MAAVQPPAFMQALTNHSALTHRRNTMLWTDGVTLGGTIARGGVHPGYGGVMAVTGSGSIMQVTVATGLVGIPHSQAFGGIYTCYNDANVNLAVTAAHATQYRRDLVIAEILDTNDSDGSDLWQLRVVQGTNNATSPAPLPTQPAKSILLAIVNVDPSITNLTGKVVDNRTYISTGGSALYVESSTLNPTTPHRGLLVYNNAFQNLSYWNGTKYVFISDSNWITYTPTTTNFGSATFTTRTGRYKWIAEKTIAVTINILVNAAGTGTSNIAIGLPQVPSRVSGEQQLLGRFDDAANTWYAGMGTILSTGSGAQMDRIRFPTDSTSDLDSFRGVDCNAGCSINITGVYEVA